MIEGKIPLQTRNPLYSLDIVMETPPSFSNQMAMVPAQFGTGAPGPSMTMGTELDRELQRLLAPLYQGVGEADDSTNIALDLSFLESMAAGVKEMQA